MSPPPPTTPQPQGKASHARTLWGLARRSLFLCLESLGHNPRARFLGLEMAGPPSWTTELETLRPSPLHAEEHRLDFSPDRGPPCCQTHSQCPRVSGFSITLSKFTHFRKRHQRWKL